MCGKLSVPPEHERLAAGRDPLDADLADLRLEAFSMVNDELAHLPAAAAGRVFLRDVVRQPAPEGLKLAERAGREGRPGQQRRDPFEIPGAQAAEPGEIAE